METGTRFEDMAYGPIGKAVKDAMPHTEADPIGVLASVLALYSSAINGHVFQTNGKPCAVWTVLVGRSKIGRKGFALDTAEAIVRYAIGDFLKHHRRHGVTSGPALVDYLYRQYQKTETQEGGPDGRLILVEEEWSTTLKRTTRCPTFGGVFRTAWDGKPVGNSAKSKTKAEEAEQSVERPQLGFHAHIQPGTWARYISQVEAEGGTYNRILPVLVTRSKLLPTMDKNPLSNIKPSRALKLAYDWARKEPRMMVLTDEARELYDDLRARYEDELAELPESISCFIERADEQVMRVACVLVAASRKTVIPVEAIEAARHFVEYSMASVKQLVTNAAAQSTRTVLPLDEKIRRALKNHGELSKTRLYQVLGGGRYSAAQIEQECEAMPDVEIIREERRNRAGAKPTKYRLIEMEPEEEETEPDTDKGSASTPSPTEAAELLTAFHEWATKEENQGKSVSDFLAHLQGAVKPPVKKAAAKKAPAKRTASARKATASTSTRTRSTSTGAKKAPAKKAPAKKTAARRTAALSK